MLLEPWKARAVSCLVLLALAACGPITPGVQPGKNGATLPPVSLAPGERLRVVATTNIVGDVIQSVGGEFIDLTVLMGPGVDPHSYVPTADGTRAIHDAHVVFANGAGLEVDLEEMLVHAGGQAARIELSDDLELLPLPGLHGEEEGHGDGDVDPHVWFSVPNVIHWVSRIEETFSTLDPGNAAGYRASAQAYRAELEALDSWIQEQVAQIPEANRKLVTNHPAFGYLARRYGLEMVGAVYPISPSAEPSARDMAALQDAIRQAGVPAVFTESTVSRQLAEQVARDTGVQLVPLYSGSLSEPGGGAETYIDLMRSDVGAIVEALR